MESCVWRELTIGCNEAPRDRLQRVLSEPQESFKLTHAWAGRQMQEEPKFAHAFARLLGQCTRLAVIGRYCALWRAMSK